MALSIGTCEVSWLAFMGGDGNSDLMFILPASSMFYVPSVYSLSHVSFNTCYPSILELVFTLMDFLLPASLIDPVCRTKLYYSASSSVKTMRDRNWLTKSGAVASVLRRRVKRSPTVTPRALVSWCWDSLSKSRHLDVTSTGGHA